jgi:hypothetical protein
VAEVVVQVTEETAQLVLAKLLPYLERADVRVSTRVAKADLVVYGGKLR